MDRAGVTPALAAALLLAALAPRPAAAVEVNTRQSVQTGIRIRTPLPGDASRNWFTGDLEVLPVLQGALRWHRTLLSLRLNPSLMVREPHLQQRQVFALAAGQLSLTTRGDRWDLQLEQEGSWGVQDVGTLRNPDGSLPTGVPEVQTLGAVPFLRSATSVTLNGTPAPRFGYGLMAGYLVQGSPDPTNVTMPLQWGPNGLGRVRWQPAHPDWVTTALTASQRTFSTGQQQFISMLTGAWDRSWSTRVNSSLGAGVALTRETIIEVPGGPLPGDYLEVLPVVFASVGTREHINQQVLSFQLAARLAPFADRFTGGVYERAEADAQLTWQPERTLTLRPNIGFAYAVPVGRATQAGDRVFFAEGTVTWWAQPWLGLVAYSRVALVSQPRLGIVDQVQWLGTLSVMVQNEQSFVW